MIVNVTKYSDPEDNWWILNPQMKYMAPFCELYKRDQGGAKSSKDMWCIFFLADPDEELNKFYRMSLELRLEMLISEYHAEFDLDDVLITECIQAYPDAALTAVGRAYKLEKDSFIARGMLLSSTPYTFDEVARDKQGAIIYVAGKPMIIKGNAKDLDYMRGNTGKIMQQYKNIDKMFYDEKKALRIFGGRNESIVEKGDLLEEINRAKLNLGDV